MTPNPTSAPAPQEQFWQEHKHEFMCKHSQGENGLTLRRCEDAGSVSYIEEQCTCLPIDARRLLAAFAKADRPKLAEEADKKHEECKRAGIGNFSYWVSYWGGVAAWLREKAQ